MLVSNTLWAFWGMGIFALSQWGIVVAISKCVGAESVGSFSLAMAMINPVFALFSLQLKAHFATSRTTDYQFADYTGLRVVTSCCAAFLAVAFAFWYQPDLQFLLLLAALCLVKMADSFSDIFYGLNQRFEQLWLTAISLTLRGGVGALIFSLVLYKTESLYGAVLMFGLVWWTVFFMYDLRISKRFNTRVAPRLSAVLYELLRKTWPMALAMCLSSLLINLPRYLISNNLGIETLGVFTVHAYFLTFFCMLSTAIAQASSTQMTKSLDGGMSKRLKAFIRSILIVFLFFLLLVIVSFFYGNELIRLLYSEEFENKKLLLIIISGSFLWACSNILDYGLIALRHLKTRIFAQILSGVVMIIIWNITYKKIGIYSGGLCIVSGGFVQSLCYLSVIIYSSMSKERKYQF